MTARIALTLLLAALVAAPALADPQEITDQRSSFLGAGVRFSTDKPGFRAESTENRESDRVKEATKVDPMAGGLLTQSLNGLGGGDVEYRYRYEYPYDDGSVLFDGNAVGLLCEKCKANAVLNACENCQGKSFDKLCDKCKASAILDACDACRAKIKGAPKKKAGAKADKAAAKKSGKAKKSVKKRAAEAAAGAEDLEIK